MTYVCKRCGKKERDKSGLRCWRCDPEESRLAGERMIFPTPPGFSNISQIVDDSPSKTEYSGGGGDFGGDGASGDY